MRYVFGIPRRVLLRWVSLYFMLFSLVMVAGGLVMLGDADGALAGIGSPVGALALVVGLLNFGLGCLGLLLSFWPGRKTGRRAGGTIGTSIGTSIDPPSSARIWPRNGLLRFLYQASLGLVSAALLYGLGNAVGLLALLVVVQNWAGWWYGWRMPQVQLGDSRQRVEALVGRGSFSVDCRSSYARDYSRSTDLNRCATVTLYSQSNRVSWEISYDAAGRVVSKQRVNP